MRESESGPWNLRLTGGMEERAYDYARGSCSGTGKSRAGVQAGPKRGPTRGGRWEPRTPSNCPGMVVGADGVDGDACMWISPLRIICVFSTADGHKQQSALSSSRHTTRIIFFFNPQPDPCFWFHKLWIIKTPDITLIKVKINKI